MTDKTAIAADQLAAAAAHLLGGHEREAELRTLRDQGGLFGFQENGNVPDYLDVFLVSADREHRVFIGSFDARRLPSN